MSNAGEPLEQSARAIAQIETDSFTENEEVLDRLTHRIGTPRSVWICLGIVVAWIALNAGLRLIRVSAPDPYPFAFLQFAASVAAVIMTLLIFSAERRLTDAERRRARLMLHLTLLTEQKTAKIIELLEALRKDDPRVNDRFDAHAEALKQATDPAEALRALDRSTQEAQSNALERGTSSSV